MADCGAVPTLPRVTRPLLAVAAAVVLVAGGACSSGGDGGGDRAVGGGAAEASRPAGPPYAVGRHELTLVDGSRPTPAVPAQGRAAEPDRTIEVEVVYPAAGDAPPEPAAGAPSPAEADAEPLPGPWPLVVFAHGFNGRSEFFRGFAEQWARQGYAVALPTFPLSRQGIAYSDDYVNQPGDVSFVVDRLADLDAGDLLDGVIDTDRYLVGGHSLGSATVFGVAYNSCCLDPRIVGAISVSGGPLLYPDGNYDHHPTTPMLMIHGGQDQTVAVGVGDLLFDQGWASPLWYLRPPAATHVSVFTDEPGRLFTEASLAFLDAELGDDPGPLDAMGADVAANGAAEWRTKP